MTNTIGGMADADCILVTGANVSETHPVTGTYIKNAVQKGAKLIIVDPRKIDLVRQSHLWMRQRGGTDVAWINGMVHVIIKEGLANETFIKERTENFEEVKKTVESYTPERVEEITGIPKEKLIEAARVFATSEKSSIVYSMGITQHTTGCNNVTALANLAMVTGQIGRAGTGVNPLRGQNNVQGACDMGAVPVVYTGYQKVGDPAVQEKFEKAWGVEGLSPEPGLTVVEIVKGGKSKKVRGLYIMGENPMLSDPNQQHVEESLKAVDFLVVQDIFMSETAQLADVVLPAAAFAEKDGTFTNSERRVLRIRKAVEPQGEARADWEIISGIAKRMGYNMEYANAQEIFEEISAVTPSYGGISYKRIEQRGLQWPCPTPEHPGTEFLHGASFARGLGMFKGVEYKPSAETTDNDYPFMLSTGRVMYHYHTATMTRKSTPLNKFVKDAYAEVNAGDLEKLGVKDGDRIKVATRRGEIEIYAKKSDRVDEGVIFIPFHFVESPANRLTNDALDPVAKTPELKVAACKVEKLA